MISRRTLWALSELVSELPELRELEISPLVVTAREVYASGARAAIAAPAPEAGRYGHMAIHPYPSDIGARWQLADGVTVTVRPIRPEDAEMEASFVRNLYTLPKLKELPYRSSLRRSTSTPRPTSCATSPTTRATSAS